MVDESFTHIQLKQGTAKMLREIGNKGEPGRHISGYIGSKVATERNVVCYLLGLWIETGSRHKYAYKFIDRRLHD